MHPSRVNSEFKWLASYTLFDDRYIASERCCATLKNYVQGKCTIPQIPDNKELMRQITAGIEYLHSRDICHRDLKPSNILISRSDGTLPPQIKLSEFAFTRTSKTALPLHKLAGTKGWMAPEMYNEESFTSSLDIFSLGLVFVFVLSGGLHAFGTDKEERNRNIKKKRAMTFTIQQLQNVVGAVEIYDLIRSMLSFIPEERPSASAILNNSFFRQNKSVPSAIEYQTQNGKYWITS